MPHPPFIIKRPARVQYPIIVSVPHCGTMLPEAELALFEQSVAKKTADTDWWVHELYNFTQDMGITLIHAVYSRYVVDLNRDPGGQKLYSDQRVETGLYPLTTFHGESLYPQGFSLTDEIRKRRMDLYYKPYYQAIEALIQELKQEWREVLFYDAHSIARMVPTIRDKPFPDLILGNQDGKTADAAISEIARSHLSSGEYELAFNEPFKGGYLTRYWGKPQNGTHALQLEMSQDLYLKDNANELDSRKVARMQPLLEKTLRSLGEELKKRK